MSFVLFMLSGHCLSQVQGIWTNPVLIDTATPSTHHYLGSAMAQDDSGRIYVTFSSLSSESLFVASSSDNGNSWIRYGYSNAPESIRTPVDIAIDHRGEVWLLWSSTDGGDFDPYYINLSKSIDNARTFTTVFRALASGGGSLSEKLAVDEQNSVYMLWDEQQVKLTKFVSGDISQRIDNEIPNDTMMFGSNTCLEVTKDFVVHCIWEGSYFDSLNNFYQFVFYSRSNDSGRTFLGRVKVDPTTGPYQNYKVAPSLAVDSDGVVFVSYCKGVTFDYSGVYVARSTDQGQSFDSPLLISDTLDAYSSRICVDSRQGVNILWGPPAQDYAHYRSTDGGESFSYFSPFPHIGSSTLIAGKNGFVYDIGSNGSGFGFTKTNVILSVHDDELLPPAFTLQANYPNPFNETTAIPFMIAQACEVNLSVYDITGREVAALLTRHVIPGSYTVHWNAAKFGSGVYFTRLVAGTGFVATRKMILLK